MIGALLGVLRAIPLWVWVGVALLAAGLFYGHTERQKGIAEGKQTVQAKWDAQKAKDQAEVDRQNRENRAKEAADQQAASKERQTYEQAIADGKARAAGLADDLRAERRKLRDFWTGGRCDAGADSAADRSGEDPAELRSAAVQRIVAAGAEADSRITFLLSRYAQAEKTCGTIPTE